MFRKQHCDDARRWYGIVVPEATPNDMVVEKPNTAINAARSNTPVKAHLVDIESAAPKELGL